MRGNGWGGGVIWADCRWLAPRQVARGLFTLDVQRKDAVVLVAGGSGTVFFDGAVHLSDPGVALCQVIASVAS